MSETILDNLKPFKNNEKAFYFTLILWDRTAVGSDIGCCRGHSPLPYTHVSKACREKPCFEENWMDFLEMLFVSTLNSL